jgi:hypothetical protein
MTANDFDENDFSNLDGMTDDYPDSLSIFIAELDDTMQEKLAGTKWEAQISTLNEDTPWEERITLYQALRAEEVFPPEASYFLLVWAIESMAQKRIDELYNSQYAARVDKIRQHYGLSDDEGWETGEVPAEFQQVETEFRRAVDGILSAEYQHVGEGQIADLIEKDAVEAQRLYTVGNDYFENLIGE